MEFTREFPNDAACLEWLWRERYAPDGHHTYCKKCDTERKFHKVNGRPTWDCDHCGHHINPLAGTIFHKSSTSLRLWFYAIHLMTSTRCGIAAKQLERELGVTYKTAWRMFNLIRNRLMAEDDPTQLTGVVEVDEASVEGRPRRKMNRQAAARLRERSRTTVVAAVERGGRVKAWVLESRRGPELPGTVVEWVRPESIVYTDEWPSYNSLGRLGFDHSRVRHAPGEYVIGDWHTNTVEGFFGNLKTGIRGNYKKVSRRWLQGYLNEFTWRYNHRATLDGRQMFQLLLRRAASGA
ncbi:MAG TPA: IS1595 family transposase [Solirubrobacteraceae bacterium]|nr:IS1595 family transposase [Solirubrobacteraceae bacterium]